METMGSGAVTASFGQAVNADVIVVIGANPTVNHPVAATFFKTPSRPARPDRDGPRGCSDPLRRHDAASARTDVALLSEMM